MTACKTGADLTGEEVANILTADLWPAMQAVSGLNVRLRKAGAGPEFDPTPTGNCSRAEHAILRLIWELRDLMDDPDPDTCDVEAVKEVQAKLRAIAADLASANERPSGRGILT